jgi:5S rRNA maturation endonuclease (ribonuclease M5)
MKTREQILRENPLDAYLASRGIKLIGAGSERKCKCPLHKDKSPSMSVNLKMQVWTCYAGCGGGSVLDLMSRLEGVSVGELMKRLGDEPEKQRPQTERNEPKVPILMEATVRPKLVKTYNYTTATRELVYQACRLEPKGFRQRRPNPNHNATAKAGADNPAWLWNMEGVERVLYQLPIVLKTKTPIWVTEGEKDADNLTQCGCIATCNVGGAGKWMDAYSENLKNREVILCGDNDKAGVEHMKEVLESLAGKAKVVRVVKVPSPAKDISEWLESQKWILTEGQSEAEAKFLALQTLVNAAPMFERGINLPVLSMAELEREYAHSVTVSHTRSLDFTSWLPSLGRAVRPLVGGEMVGILAGTAVGKTALASNLVMHAAPLWTVFFEQELPGSLTFERLAAMATVIPSREVYNAYRGNSGMNVNWRDTGKLGHIFVCTRSRLTVEQMEELIVKSELKIGERPALVVVDYIQLMGGKGERRERVANAAEGLKALAKNTNTIVAVISQISRKDSEYEEVHLYDAKEAGEIENSCGLVLGAWRSEQDTSLLTLRVLKNTKGYPGATIKCNFDGERMLITERAEEVDTGPSYHAPHND